MTPAGLLLRPLTFDLETPIAAAYSPTVDATIMAAADGVGEAELE